MTDSESRPINTRARGGILLPKLSNPSRLRNRFQLLNARRNLNNEIANSNQPIFHYFSRYVPKRNKIFCRKYHQIGLQSAKL